MRSGKDWTLMLQAVLPNSGAQSIRRRLDPKASKSGLLPSIMCVQCIGFRIQSQNLKTFYHG